MILIKPMSNDLHDMIATVACEAALAAGMVAHRGFVNASPETLATEQKAGFFDIVTASDKAAERAACETIWSRIPASRRTAVIIRSARSCRCLRKIIVTATRIRPTNCSAPIPP